MSDRSENAETVEPGPRASGADRTKVVILAQVVVIVALVVLWSILRARRSPCPQIKSVPAGG